MNSKLASDILELESLASGQPQPPSAKQFPILVKSTVQSLNETPIEKKGGAPISTVTINSGSPLQQAAPAYTFKNERASHRIILELIAKGYTDREIAEQLGVSAPHIGYVRKQPRYQEQLLNEVQRKANEDQQVVEFIRSKVLGAVETLAEVMEDTQARKSDRISAAEALLNRRYGKPNQPVNAGNTVDLNHLSDDDLAKMIPNNATTTSAAV